MAFDGVKKLWMNGHLVDFADAKVHVFTHLSHLYPSGSSLYLTYLFRLARDPDATLERWQAIKLAASTVIAAEGATISSQCSVFAESEVITLINEDIELADIIAGLNNSVAGRLSGMVGRVGLVEDAVLTGGCAKNESLARALEQRLKVKIKKLPTCLPARTSAVLR